MKHYAKHVTWIVVFMMMMTMFAASTPAYAFSVNDLLGSSSGMSGGGGLLDIIIGLLLGNILGKSADIPEGTNNTTTFPTGTTTKNNKELVGFYAEWWGSDTSSFTSMSKHTDIIKTIAPFWATLQENGTVSDRGGDNHAGVVEFAHENDISVLLLVNNEKQKNGNIPIHTILNNPALRTKAITSMEAYIKKYNLDGINIDFEMVPPEDRDNLSAFMKELYGRLKPQGYTVSIDVFPKQDESNDVAAAYDYAALAKYADKIMVMTYDNHGMWSGAGPIADINWVENNLKYALKYIPKNKLYLGIAGYGYDWSARGVESLEYAPLTALAEKHNATIKWDDTAKSPYFYYTDEAGVAHEVWFENSESLKHKLDLVNQYDIAGAALWKLGEEDPGYWRVFKDKQFKK
ncbi:hypothetical protein P22_2230 [Propionispora sp. 2/2-37]|uniref:glycosyl hydrolase family 18 protein n=1 Tax=Propionispora sp. 2/2-37 TaxID=1677858 RepID=UPI0006BB5570|nr:glycosyl hydrolase family 18 protein [Propionispora sp. 2/2-37]CUH96142.1 hypothetical protein P22_2230 [Propionispora sp. 2/2-37]